MSAPRHDDDGLSLRAEPLDLRADFAQKRDATLFDERWLPGDHLRIIDQRRNAFAGDGTKVRRSFFRRAFALRKEADGLTERMLGWAFDRASNGEEFVAADAKGLHISHRRTPVGERAGLIEHDRIDG